MSALEQIYKKYRLDVYCYLPVLLTMRIQRRICFRIALS